MSKAIPSSTDMSSSAGAIQAQVGPGLTGRVTADAAAIQSAPGLTDSVEIRWQKFCLANGLTVIVHEDRKAPLVTVNIWYRVGAKDEPAGKTGFAHLFEHLMFGGSKHLPGQYINKLLEVGATDLNGTTSYDRTNYYQTVPTGSLDYALFAESDRMGHFYDTISEETLELQRGVVLNEKRDHEGRPYGLVNVRLAHALYPVGHPYAHPVIGSTEDVERATLDDVRAWFKTHYGPSNAVLVLAGDIDLQTAREKVTQYFGDIPPGLPQSRPMSWVVKRRGVRREILEDRVPNALVRMAWNIPQEGDPESPALQIVAASLGGGLTSRLHQRLVRELEIAVMVSAGVAPGLIAGTLQVSATVREGADIHEVERVINEEIARFVARGPEAAEVERIKVQMQSGLIRHLATTQAVADLLAKNEVYFGDPDFYREEMRRLAAVTPKQAQTAAERWLVDGAYVLHVLPYRALRADVPALDRTVPPAVGQPGGIRLPRIHDVRLSNGMRVLLAERHELPLVNCTLIVEGGAKREPRQLEGLANLTADLMTGGGAGQRTTRELREFADSQGAGIGAACTLDFAMAGVSTFKSKLDVMLDLFADVVLRPRFDEAEVRQARTAQLEGIAMEVASPQGAVGRVLQRLMYGRDHGYARALSGSRSTVGRIGQEDVRTFKERLFHPDGAVLLVVGDTTLNAILPKLEARLGEWRAAAQEPAVPIARPAPAKSGVYLIDKPGAMQSTIAAALVAPPYDADRDIALGAVNRILGGSFFSRINMNLRETRHWTYGVQEGFSDEQHARLFRLSVAVQADKTVDSLLEIQREFADIIGRRPIELRELQAVQQGVIRELPAMVQSLDGLGHAIDQVWRRGLPLDYWSGYADKWRALSLDEVNTAARALIDPAAVVFVVAGDRARIEGEGGLEKLGDVTIIDAGDESLLG